MADLATLRMPFGKHRGTLVADLPTGYLRWLRRSVPLRGDLRDAVDVVLEQRAEDGGQDPGPDYERWGCGWRRRA